MIECTETHLFIVNCSDYLTGFRRRKTQRQQKAAEYAREQARKERVETRKEVGLESQKLTQVAGSKKSRYSKTITSGKRNP